MQLRLNNISKFKERRVSLRKNQTSHEVLLWAKIRRSQLGFKFKRQHSVGPYILDFYCPQNKLAIEIDGSQHIENKDYDKERSGYLSVLGINVIRFWNNEINTNIDSVIQKIRCELGPTSP